MTPMTDMGHQEACYRSSQIALAYSHTQAHSLVLLGVAEDHVGRESWEFPER